MNRPVQKTAELEQASAPPSQAPATRIAVSAIILTLDEEINIARCLTCLDRIDDLILVDSGSTDRTLAIAQEVRPEVRSFHHSFQDFGDQRNWAIDHTEPKHDWILFVDADEFCTPELLDEIDAFVREPGEHVGAFIAGKTYFLGRWLKHAALYPSYQLRLLRRGDVRFRKEGHGQREATSGPLHYLQEAWIHEGFSKGIQQWIDRHNKYSTDEVELIFRLRCEPLVARELFTSDAVVRRRALKKLGARLPLRPLSRFFYAYVMKRGFLDGVPGLIFCLLRLAHDIHIVAKLAEHRNKTS